MENNNEWNRGLNSALQGLGALGQGFIIKGQKNDANATYNEARTQLMSNYDKLMKFNTDKLELANTNPEVNTDGVQKELYAKLLGDYENAQQKLQSNPYGQTSAKVLEDYYSKLIPKAPKLTTQFDKTNNMMITFDEQGNIIKTQHYTKPKEQTKKSKEFKLTDGTQFRQNEDGTWTAWNPNELGLLEPTEYKITDSEYQKAYGEKTTTVPKLRGGLRVPKMTKKDDNAQKKQNIMEQVNTIYKQAGNDGSSIWSTLNDLYQLDYSKADPVLAKQTAQSLIDYVDGLETQVDAEVYHELQNLVRDEVRKLYRHYKWGYNETEEYKHK